MTDSSGSASPSQESAPLISHLIELRNRLLYSVIAVAVVFILLLPFANTLYTFVAAPLLSLLPESSSIIATEVAAPFLAPFKLTFFVAFVVAAPYVFYQVWGFLAPALYQHEKGLILPLIITSIVLFYLGIAFAYGIVFPLVFEFFTSTAPKGVAVMTDMGNYLNFVLKLFIAFGVVFEIPIAIILLIRSGVVTAQSLSQKRPYIIVACFVVGMLLTPPDVISQILLAVPMWLLFEAGVFLGRGVSKNS